MKFGITISDLTLEEARTVLERVGATNGSVAIAQPIPMTDGDDDETGDVATSETDSSGLPWDARIHASTKTVNKDGTWKKRKGVQQVDVDAVEAELRAANAPTAPVPTAPFPPVDGRIIVPTQPAPAFNPPMPPAPVATPAPVPTAPVAAPAAPSRDFSGLMRHISTLYQTGRLTDQNFSAEIVTAINGAFGTSVQAITDIAASENMVNYAWQCLDVRGLGA